MGSETFRKHNLVENVGEKVDAQTETLSEPQILGDHSSPCWKGRLGAGGYLISIS